MINNENSKYFNIKIPKIDLLLIITLLMLGGLFALVQSRVNITAFAQEPPPGPQCAARQCADGQDNDADGKTDFGTSPTNDPGCASLQDSNETDGPTTPPCVLDADCGPAMQCTDAGICQVPGVPPVVPPAGPPPPPGGPPPPAACGTEGISCTNNSQCCEGLCNPSNQTCAGPAICPPDTQVCGFGNNRVCLNGSTCEAAGYCAAGFQRCIGGPNNGICIPGTSDCNAAPPPAPACLADNTACTSNSQCCTQLCNSGTGLCASSNSCGPLGVTLCQEGSLSRCFVTGNDPANCGRCGNVCPSRHVCADGACVGICNDDSDCPRSQICHSRGTCAGPGPACNDKSDCPSKRVCRNHLCSQP